jgi:hypothetical protein
MRWVTPRVLKFILLISYERSMRRRHTIAPARL